MSKEFNDWLEDNQYTTYVDTNNYAKAAFNAVKERTGPNLRDQFAMAALQGMIASGKDNWSWADFALEAYSSADAMLKQRKK